MRRHDFSVAGHRSALLMKFSDNGSTGPVGLRTPSMHGDLCAGANYTFGPSSSKIDSYNKSSQQQGTNTAGPRRQSRVTTLPPVPAGMSSTGEDQGGAGGGGVAVNVGPQTPTRQVGARSRRIPTKRNDRRNPSLSTGRGSALSTELLSVEVVKQGVRDCRQEAKKLAASSATSVKNEDVDSPITVEATSKPPVNRRGVRERPGVKGYLVEIRPKRWKKTIWLGTYNTLWEACRAYDAGIFYTKKGLPFNCPDSQGSFPELPGHLSLRMDEDPIKLKEVKNFVKAQALKASKRAIDCVPVNSSECSVSTYSDLGPNSPSELEKVATTTQSSCCPVTPEEKEKKETEEEDEVDIHFQIPNMEDIILKHLDSLLHLCTGEEGGFSSSQDDMGEGSVSPEERNLNTMTKESESISLQKPWDDDEILVSTGSYVEGAVPVNHSSFFKYFSEDLMPNINYDISQQAASKGKSSIKLEKLCVAGFSMDPPEIMTQDWYMKSSISDNLDTQFHRDDSYEEWRLWDNLG